MTTILFRYAFIAIAGLVSLALLPLAVVYLLRTLLVYRDHPATVVWSGDLPGSRGPHQPVVWY
jgi:hypothetical protein